MITCHENTLQGIALGGTKTSSVKRHQASFIQVLGWLEDIFQLMEFRKKRWPRLKAGCLAGWEGAVQGAGATRINVQPPGHHQDKGAQFATSTLIVCIWLPFAELFNFHIFIIHSSSNLDVETHHISGQQSLLIEFVFLEVLPIFMNPGCREVW